MDIDRNVRRKLDRALPTLSNLVATPAIDLQGVLLLFLASFRRHQRIHCSTSAHRVNGDAVLPFSLECLERQTADLLAWCKGGMLAFPSLSENRREKWANYPPQEKWMYYATELLNDALCWADISATSIFVDDECPLPAPSTNRGQVVCLAALVQHWNWVAEKEGIVTVDLVVFASLELWWFGYKNQRNGVAVTVPMTFDESATGHRLIVNRLEHNEEVNDFESIVFHNTVLRNGDGTSAVPELALCDLSYLLAGELSHHLLHLICERKSEGTADELWLNSVYADLREIVRFMHGQPAESLLGGVFAWTVGCLIRDGVGPSPSDKTFQYSSALEAFTAALQLNERNYRARQCLVECYVDIGEHYLAHQHCLRLVEDLAQHVAGDCSEAPIAVVAHDYAAELLDTVLLDIHQLHVRGEEGYERLDVIPGVGTRIDVEWALDDEIVLYRGTVQVQPDGRGLCVSYVDDTEPGQHQRRFESALHLVNINDPHDQYLESYFLVEDAPEEERRNDVQLAP
jgi:hypothetical protein